MDFSEKTALEWGKYKLSILFYPFEIGYITVLNDRKKYVLGLNGAKFTLVAHTNVNASLLMFPAVLWLFIGA